jgi:hypothetical protein
MPNTVLAKEGFSTAAGFSGSAAAGRGAGLDVEDRADSPASAYLGASIARPQ